MSRAKVWLNGEYVGEWPYGYASFELDLTKHFKFGQPNKLAVRLENLPSASRWYSGAGIFRDVRLVAKPQTHVENWGTYVTTPKISGKIRDLPHRDVGGGLFGFRQKGFGEDFNYFPERKDRRAEDFRRGDFGRARKGRSEIEIKSPELWTLESPALYTAKTGGALGRRTRRRIFYQVRRALDFLRPRRRV